MNHKDTNTEQVLLSGLHEVLGSPDKPFALHEPEFTEYEHELVQECLRSTFVSTVGKYVDQFESMLCEQTGAKHAVAVVNGTAALQIALKLAGVRNGDEVLIPALTFVATANAVDHCGGVPHFVDSDFSSMGMDPRALAEHLGMISETVSSGLKNRITGRRISAVVPMHTYGHPVDMTPLLEIAARYGITVVEDAAESLGSTYHGQQTGTFGLLNCLSFNGNKIITTGGGGAILTDDAELARQAKHLTTTAKVPHRWKYFHDAPAWNYRLPNLNAALGCAQIDRLPDFIERKRRLADQYHAVFQKTSHLEFMSEPTDTQSNYWLNTVRMQEPNMDELDRVLESANNSGFQCRPTWTLLHKLPMYSESPSAPLPVAEQLEASLINLPSSATLVTY